MASVLRASVPLAAAWAAISIALLLSRSGLLALLGAVAGIVMLVKAWRRPGEADLRWIVGGVVAWTLVWGVTLGLVYYGWESGEVVVLRPVDPATGESSELRVWVVDDEVGGGPVVFYDGPRERLAAIGAQDSLEWVRGDATRRSRPVLHWYDDASPEFVERITALYDAKYGHLEWATNAFFVLAGRAPGRTVGVLELGAAEPR